MFSETSSRPKDPFILQRLYTRKKLTPFDAIANSFRDALIVSPWPILPGWGSPRGVKVFIWRKVGPATEEVGPTIGKG